MNKALILVDFENEWIDNHSENYVGDISEVIIKVNKLLNFSRKKNYKIIFTRHIENEFGSGFLEGSKNIDIISEIDISDSDVVINKNKISPFYKTNLEKELEGIEKIVVCGILTNLCVRSLIQDAYDRDFEIKVITDCCVAFEKEINDFTFKDLKETREEIEFLRLEEFL